MAYLTIINYLRLWSGLVLQNQGKHPAALMEFAAAIKLGCDRWLVHWYLVQSALQIQDCSAAESALTHVVNAAPDFVEAQVLFEKLKN